MLGFGRKAHHSVLAVVPVEGFGLRFHNKNKNCGVPERGSKRFGCLPGWKARVQAR